MKIQKVKKLSKRPIATPCQTAFPINDFLRIIVILKLISSSEELSSYDVSSFDP